MQPAAQSARTLCRACRVSLRTAVAMLPVPFCPGIPTILVLGTFPAQPLPAHAACQHRHRARFDRSPLPTDVALPSERHCLDLTRKVRVMVQPRDEMVVCMRRHVRHTLAVRVGDTTVAAAVQLVQAMLMVKALCVPCSACPSTVLMRRTQPIDTHVLDNNDSCCLHQHRLGHCTCPACLKRTRTLVWQPWPSLSGTQVAGDRRPCRARIVTRRVLVRSGQGSASSLAASSSSSSSSRPSL